MAAIEFRVGDVVKLDTNNPDNMYLANAHALDTFTIKKIEYDEETGVNLLHFEEKNTVWFEWRVRKVGEAPPPEPQNPWWENDDEQEA